jgi:hypothetical protein
MRDVPPLAKRAADAAARARAIYETVAHPLGYKGAHVASRRPFAAGIPARQHLALLEVILECAQRHAPPTDGAYRVAWLNGRTISPASV